MKRNIFTILFLAAQLFLIGYARFIPERFFCWAPYDQHTYYEIQVRLDNNLLNTGEVAARYKYKAKGWEPRSIYNVFNMVKHFEEGIDASDRAQVLIRYSINGRKQQEWRYE